MEFLHVSEIGSDKKEGIQGCKEIKEIPFLALFLQTLVAQLDHI